MSAPSANALHDYLGLLQQPIGALRLLLFHGASGSGKSSQIALLLARHPELAGRRIAHAAPDALPDGRHDVLVLEELLTGADCLVLGAALRRSRLLLVASHVAPHWLWPWRLRVPSRCFRIDAVRAKLDHALRQRDVRFSERALDAFLRRFGANYTDLDILLEHTGVDDLDQALALFGRDAAIRHG